METPPPIRSSHPKGDIDPQYREQFINRLSSKNPIYCKKELFPQGVYSQRQNVKKMMDELKKQTRFLDDTKWMFDNENTLPTFAPL